MKEKMVKRYVALRENYTKSKLYLSGHYMYPYFYRTNEEARKFNKSYVFMVKIPARLADGNDL